MNTKNQFFYTRKEAVKSKDGVAPILKDRIDSFNLTQVLKTIEVDDGALLVILNDGHEESRQVGVDKKGQSVRERQYVASQIVLEGVDVGRFRTVSAAFETALVLPKEEVKD